MIVRDLGETPYLDTWQLMQAFTAGRNANTPDEIWLTSHPPVYTLGQAGLESHLLQTSRIPLIKTDRGGQITYHGPGQIIVYLLVNLPRRGYGVRELVSRMEQAIIDLLAEQEILAHRREQAPGVYVNDAKIASLGLRVRHGCTYHGLALNTDMDLRPFSAINPCGYANLPVTQLRDLADNVTIAHTSTRLVDLLTQHINRPYHRQDSRG